MREVENEEPSVSSSQESHSRAPAVSVILATFNSAPWLPTTLDSIVVAALRTLWPIEIVVVDDGSTDDTATVLRDYAAAAPIQVRIVSQENKGRFLAFWEAAKAARGERILIFGARMLLQPDAFEYLERVDPSLPAGQVWNGHVPTDAAAPLVGRFWEVPTHLFWGSYLAHPAPTTITPEIFDRVPKGTGCLLIGRELFIQACLASWPEGNAALVSDDTKLLRYVVERTPMRLDPGFGAIYRPRVSVRSFLGHAFVRGTLFVDSYAGTGLIRNITLLALVVAPVVALALLAVAIAAGAAWAVILLLALVVVGLVSPAIVAAFRACAPRAILSYLTYVVPFGAVFWAGLSRGIIIHRRSFGRAAKESTGTQ